jgi:sulfate permease, SulP family
MRFHKLPARYLDAFAENIKTTIGFGLRQTLREGYKRSDLKADLLAGLIVGIVALPLSMALAIQTGVKPQYGLYTAIVAGIAVPLLGGTRMQVTGPTAAFIPLLAPVVIKFGIGGLLCAGFLAGLILVLMGVMKLGRLIQFIPHPVTTGFTAGIAIVIGTSQLKDLFGLTGVAHGETYLERWGAMWAAGGTASGWALLVGLFTLILLIVLPRVIKKVPAPLLAMVAAGLLVLILDRLVPGFHVVTVGNDPRFLTSTYHGIPPLPPMPVLPWAVPGEPHFDISLETIQAILPSAFAIAMLGAIESLLSAVVADGMSGTKHDPDAELLGVGIANMLCPFFGGIAATGALARTATNIRAGARSPFSSVFHALFILLCTLVLAPLVGYLPLAAMAALLLVVAKNMSEARHFVHILRVAPRSDVIILLICFFLTVFMDMVIAVSVGVMLAALMFMKRMAALTDVKLDTGTMQKYELPDGVRLYEIAGPLFFGAAQRAMSAFDTVGRGERSLAVILYLGQVPAIDATGLVALETMIGRLQRSGHKVIFAGLQAQPAQAMAKAGFVKQAGKLAFAPDVDTAVSLAIVHSARQPAFAAAT